MAPHHFATQSNQPNLNSHMTPHFLRTDTPPQEPQAIALDFFCGGGGTTRGLIDAGIYVAAGVDNNPDCALTYVTNNHNITADRKPPAFILKDISDLKPHPFHDTDLQITQAIDAARSRHPAIPLIFAISAPCQPYSRFPTHQMTRPKLAKRGQDRELLSDVARYIEEHLPELIISENVTNITAENNRASWDGFTGSLDRLGYVYDHQPINAVHFQIPQSRRRIILLAARQLPHQQFLLNLEVPRELPDSRTISVQEAIAHLPPLLSGQAVPHPPNHAARSIHLKERNRVRRIPPGHPNNALPNVLRRERDQPDMHSDKQGFSDTYTRMAADQPAPTITTRFLNVSNGRYAHYDELQARGISLREGATLQSFPDDYAFLSKNAATNAAMIGNAVPPKLAQHMATHLINFWHANNVPHGNH